VTLAHELGHYVGLLHTFSEVECLYDDACSDTPICDYTAYREQVSKFMTEYTRRYGSDYRFSLDQLALRENCQEAGKTYVADNIMDYNYCYSNTFTAQQRARIRYVLNYAPLVPGPKLDVYKVKGATRSASSLRPVLSDCPSISDHHFNVVP
jgi:zinc-dependent metalloproteinase lipoprotein